MHQLDICELATIITTSTLLENAGLPFTLGVDRYFKKFTETLLCRVLFGTRPHVM